MAEDTSIPVVSPTEVIIGKDQEAVPVFIADESEHIDKKGKSKDTTVKGEGITLAPTTTEAEDKVTEGQRHINLIWESSQSTISLLVTMAVIYCQIYSINSETLNNAFFFVVATYLNRTNHTRRGGVDSSYKGR